MPTNNNIVYSNGNRKFRQPLAEMPQMRQMTPPEMLLEIAVELKSLDEFELAVGLRDIASRWEQPWFDSRVQVWLSRLEDALEADYLSDLSQRRVKILLESLVAYRRDGEDNVPPSDPYAQYAAGEIFFCELKEAVINVDLAQVRAARRKLAEAAA